jgi:hypothetical protein
MPSCLALHDSRTCQRCGRIIEWRRKWKDVWDSIRYCSDACRRARLDPLDAALEQQILSLLTQRAGSASICPSEAARQVFSEHWQQQMERTRQAARRLTAQGLIEITQQSRVVDPSTAKGPIRLRRGPHFPSS